MKKITLFAVSVLALAGCASSGGGGDAVHYFSIEDALNSPEAAGVVNPNIKLQFANSGSGNIIRSGLVSNKKTNAVGKSAEEACRWAFLSAVKQFQSTAQENNANQVVNLISYYKKQPYSSSTNYECRVGAIMAGVALKGDLAK